MPRLLLALPPTVPWITPYMTVSWPPYATDERDLAIRHMERLTKPGLTGSLLLPDRWYPSRAFIAQTLNMRFSFVMRVREKWNLEADQIKTQGEVTISQKGQVFTRSENPLVQRRDGNLADQS